MATGPQRARLDRALAGAHDGEIERHAREWDRCQQILQQIGMSLVTASPEVKEQIGGRTGPAVDVAFTTSAHRMGDKAAELFQGARALRDAADAITAARAEQARLAAAPLTEPPPYRKPAGQPTRADLHEEAQSRQAHQAYQSAYADQEARAKQQADAMDRVFQHSSATMQRIHGEPDPRRPAARPTARPGAAARAEPGGRAARCPPAAAAVHDTPSSRRRAATTRAPRSRATPVRATSRAPPAAARAGPDPAARRAVDRSTPPACRPAEACSAAPARPAAAPRPAA